MSERKLKSISLYTGDVLQVLEKYDHELVGKLRAKIKDGVLVIPRSNYKIILTFEEVEKL